MGREADDRTRQRRATGTAARRIRQNRRSPIRTCEINRGTSRAVLIRAATSRKAIRNAQAELARIIRNECPGPHNPVRHGDGKPSWCNACGRTRMGANASEIRRLRRPADLGYSSRQETPMPDPDIPQARSPEAAWQPGCQQPTCTRATQFLVDTGWGWVAMCGIHVLNYLSLPNQSAGQPLPPELWPGRHATQHDQHDDASPMQHATTMHDHPLHARLVGSTVTARDDEQQWQHG